MFQLTFLGTSAGIPTKHRNVTALAIECVNTYLSGDKQTSKSKRPWVLIDCGEGTQQQLLRTKLSVQQLAIICITHVHGDHCYGLPGLLASMAMSGRTDKLTLLAPKAIETLLDTVMLTTDLHFSYPIEFVAIEDYFGKAENDPFCQDQCHPLSHPEPLIFDFSPTHSLRIDITKLSHRVPSHAFCLTQTVKSRQLQTSKLKELGIPAGPIWGKLQQGHDVTFERDSMQEDSLQFLTEQKAQSPLILLQAKDYVKELTVSTKIVIAGDNDNPDLLSRAVKGASLLVHEATYTQAVADNIAARPESIDPMHTTAKRIASFAELTQVPNLILTHFSARYQPFDDPESKTANMSDIRFEAKTYYKGNLWLAKDFECYWVADTVTLVSTKNNVK